MHVLCDILKPRRLTEVVDIGANPIDEEPPYKTMLADGACRVTGFEPQAEALAALAGTPGQGSVPAAALVHCWSEPPMGAAP